MQKIFVDANVLIAILKKDLHELTNCQRILSLSNLKQFEIYVTPVTLSIYFYFAEKVMGNSRAINAIKNISDNCKIASNMDKHISEIINNNSIKDIEDGIQYMAAIDNKCAAIITLDTYDYYFSKIPVYTPYNYLVETFSKA
jgi:predicted nucleic acid-binding protein